MPEHTSATFEAGGSLGATALTDGPTYAGATTSVVVNNPSSVRGVSIAGTFGLLAHVSIGTGHYSLLPDLAVTRNAVPFSEVQALRTIPGDPGLAAEEGIFWDASLVDSIAAGASVTYAVSCSMTLSGSTGSFTSSVSCRGIVVTQ